MEDTTNKVFSYLYTAAGAIGGLAVVALSLLYVFQDKLLYMPNPPGFPKTPEQNPAGCISPNEWSTSGEFCQSNGCNPIPYEDVTITTDDGEHIHAWLLFKSPTAPTLIYFHGNAGNMGFRLQNAAGMYGYSDYNVLMMDYRGYGKSTGSPSERGLQLDGVAMLKYLKQHPRLSNSPIVVFGRSLGGALAVWLAYHHGPDISGVIVENTFMSIPTMVDRLMPWATSIKWLILRIKWDSIGMIGALPQPIMFISGDRDDLVPSFHMKKLYEGAVKSAFRYMYSVVGGTHNDTWAKAGRKYYLVRPSLACSIPITGISISFAV
jgi:abhydrolase domain-containing protein 13